MVGSGSRGVILLNHTYTSSVDVGVGTGEAAKPRMHSSLNLRCYAYLSHRTYVCLEVGMRERGGR